MRTPENTPTSPRRGTEPIEDYDVLLSHLSHLFHIVDRTLEIHQATLDLVIDALAMVNTGIGLERFPETLGSRSFRRELTTWLDNLKRGLEQTICIGRSLRIVPRRSRLADLRRALVGWDIGNPPVASPQSSMSGSPTPGSENPFL